jgi:cytochrome c-type biogenesis protein CcmH
MIVWAIAIAMTAATLAVILIPLFRNRGAAPDAAAYDVEVYKDQLNQTNADYDSGLLTAEQAAATKTEISRRLLDADGRRDPQNSETGRGSPGGGSHGAVVALLVVLTPALALGFYMMRGSPHTPGQPYAERTEERAAAATQQKKNVSLESAAETLAARLKKNPDNLEGWMLLARTYTNVQRFGEASAAYARAIELDSENSDLRSAYGEALTFAANGMVTPAARAVFEETLRRAKSDARARFYLALATFQGGDKQQALDQWAALMRDSAANAPWIPAVRQRIAEAATALGQDVAAVTPQPLPPAQPAKPDAAGGPTADQVEAAQNMTPAERRDMINAMVARQAAKLDADPNNFEGWMRLIRSYAMLDQKDKAKAALATAMAHFKNAPFPKQKLTQLAVELNLNGGGAAAAGRAAPGPTQGQIADAKDMSAADRDTMIQTMVARLAKRLESEPGDSEGWMRLARSYNVLKQPEKARDALARAAKAAPSNVDILVLYARAARKVNGGRDTAESLAALRKALILAPNNIEALWYVGGAEAEAGDKAAALTLWRRALDNLPVDAPDRAEFKTRIKTLETVR